LTKAESVDQEEVEQYGKDKDVHPIDEELERRERRLEVIRKAKAELEEEAMLAKLATEQGKKLYSRRKANPSRRLCRIDPRRTPLRKPTASREGLFGASS
jgi:hypothetical protein